MKNSIKKLLPNWLITQIRLARSKSLIEEINKLSIKRTGIDSDSTPWAELENGLRFYGLSPNEDERKLYKLFYPKIRGLNENCFGVVLEIISRYLAPRSLPGELTFSPSKYDPIRDPLKDFDLTSSEDKSIASLFRPKKGSVIVDIGAFHGFGTLRMAEHIGPSGKIVAFEANPVSLKLLEKNVSANGLSNITIVPKAASNYSSDNGKFFYDGVPTGNSLRGDVLENLGIENITALDVVIDTGDNVLRHLGVKQVNHISITVNGGEPEALQGLSETITASPNMTISMPGWYYRDGERLDILLEKQLIDMDFKEVKRGRLGRVIAWK